MSNFLLEIGTEELPADFSNLVIDQLEKIVLRDLKDRRLTHGNIFSTSTPRRIVLTIEDLAEKGEDLEEERKGPPADKAFHNGSPTVAAIGFAKRLGLDINNLKIKDTSKGPFVFGKSIAKGESALNLLIDLIPIWITSLQGRRFMRWGNDERKFSRPIRWIVSLLDEKIVPVVLKDADPIVNSGNLSRGHRLYSQSVLINSAKEYFSILEKVGVIAKREKRLYIISSLIEQSALKLNARADLSDELLNELVDLVELPSIIEGNIDISFLELPAEVLSTVMKVHQRYVPLYKKEYTFDKLSLDSKNTLLPNFLCICNSLDNSKELVRLGNERVLRARLSDAEFFLNMDLSTPSSERLKQLKKVIFAEGLGTLYDRVNRITWISKLLVKYFKFGNKEVESTIQAAKLSKHDLVTQMVGEFPELQGVMGGKYLLYEGEDYETSLGVFEQYLPKYAGGKIPSTDIGCALSIADKFELIISIFYKGERPSGSSDPYALRRAGNGILQIIWSRDWTFDINNLISESIKYWCEVLPEINCDQTLLKNEIAEFFIQRIISLLLEDMKIDSDLVQAIVGNKIMQYRTLSDPYDALLRARLLSSMREEGKLLDLQRVFNRVYKLSEKGNLSNNILTPDDVIKTSLFESNSENKLLEMLKVIEPIAKEHTYGRYNELAEKLFLASKDLEEFFDGENSVMVMVDDNEIRTNRLNLLSILRNQAYELADFSRING